MKNEKIISVRWWMKLVFILHASFFIIPANGQSVSFELKSTPSIDVTFNTIEKYRTGILLPHALELKVNSIGYQWDLYVAATTTAAGDCNVLSTYSTSGTLPVPVSVVQARIYNTGNTQQSGTSFFPLTDIAMPTYIIGTAGTDSAVSCADSVNLGTNQPGSYTSDPQCYRFNVDLKINPGFNYRPGMYGLRVDFIIIRDL